LPCFWLGFPTTFLVEHLWISQVPDASLHTCHGLITPLTRHNLTNTVALLGLRWRYKPRQSGPIFYRSDTCASGTRIPYGLYDPLCTLHLSCSSSCESIADKCFTNPRFRHRRNTRYRWLVKPYL